ncbi:shikimate dehydrogenase [Rhizobiaceae bacterium BDR2-2]|uniref:shikimate dehydrogenase (NADP(+)) n=1 Tax=Ectorhizobium quercum TaxID=2965071 RepID=A0AAE3SU79_9HYPH|nr:shikimate dehydrogenase [Ectorhizobium quercum]MCX8996950.1 shikimate dehydrogenase [Ectorhizobium quercum]
MTTASPRQITGNTRIFGIVADPIYHVKTPQAINAGFERLGIDAVMIPIHVKPAGLAAVLAGLAQTENFGGLVATVPHKPAILDLCDEVTEEARHIGAVNCIRRDPDGRMIGAMLDGTGFVEALKTVTGFDPNGRRAFVAGAGGAASAIAFALAKAGAAHLTIANRTADKAEALGERIRAAYPALTISTDPSTVADHDLIANGTSLGMKETDAPPLDFDRLHKDQVVGDAIMEPEMTPLLKAAKAKGCRIQLGKPMLDCQIDLMIEHFNVLPK